MASALIILPRGVLGGAERVSKNLAYFLAHNRKFNVTVMILSKGRTGAWDDLEQMENVCVIYNKAGRELTSIFGLCCYILSCFLKKSVFDIVFTTHAHTNAFVSLARRLKILKTRLLITRESTVIFERFTGSRRLKYRLWYSLYGGQDLLVFQTQYMRSSLFESIPSLRSINNAVLRNPLLLSDIKLNQNVKLNYQFRSEVFHMIFVGRLIPLKNLEGLLDAIEIVMRRGSVSSDIHLHVLGDGPLMSELKSRVDNSILSGVVTFHGNVTNPYAYMHQCNLGVIASITEGFPNVLIEMMAAGVRNVITTPCAGDLDLLPGVEVLQDHTIESLADSLEANIAHSVDRRVDYSRFTSSIDISAFYKQMVAVADEREGA